MLTPTCLLLTASWMETLQVCRNYFGAQTSSFEVPLDTSKLGLAAKGDARATAPYPAVFIRAPAILEVMSRVFL